MIKEQLYLDRFMSKLNKSLRMRLGDEIESNKLFFGYGFILGDLDVDFSLVCA